MGKKSVHTCRQRCLDKFQQKIGKLRQMEDTERVCVTKSNQTEVKYCVKPKLDLHFKKISGPVLCRMSVTEYIH